MKKTQSVIDCIQFIDNKNLSSDELYRLMNEVEDLALAQEKIEEREQEPIDYYDLNPYAQIERENCANL